MHTRYLWCVSLLICGWLQLNAQNFAVSFEQQNVDCAIGEVCYDVQLSSDQTFEFGSSNLRFFYDCSSVDYNDGSANVNNLPASYTIINELDQCVDASGLGTLPFEQNLAFLQIAIDHNVSEPIEITSESSTILQNLCFTLLNDEILQDPNECFDVLWVTEATREGYVNSVTTINTVNSSLDPDNGQFIPLNNTNNCFTTDCVDIDDPCIPIVDADGDGVCDVGDDPDPDPTDPCVPEFTDADEDGVCDVGANADPDPTDPCNPNFIDADGDGVCDITDDPDPTDPCNPNFDAAVCLDPTVAFELSFSNVTSVDCESNTICYDVNIRSTTRPFDLGSYNLRIFYDGALADAIDQSPTLSPSPNLNNNYTISSINDMQGGDQSGNGSLPFDSNLDIIDIAVDFTTNTPIGIDSLDQTILHQLCFEATSDDLLNNPLSCFQLVWVTDDTDENYTVGITTINVASTIGITADLDSSSYVNLIPEDNCFEFACIDDECAVLACNDDVQISLDSCLVIIDADVLLEDPAFAPYSIDFFTTAGDFVRTDTLLGTDDGQTYGYRVHCQENSCWGTVRVEVNLIPEFDAPCACVNGMDELPPECIISCALSRLPVDVLGLPEIEQMLSDCGPSRFSNLSASTSVVDTFCQNNIEVFEVIYVADIERHGITTRDTLLCQRYGLENIPLEGHNFEVFVRFPKDLSIECDLSVEEQTNPDSILARTNDIKIAFPFFRGPRMTRIDTQIMTIATIQIPTGFSVQRERLVSFDTNDDGILEWVIVTDAQPIFRDSLVLDTTFVEVFDSFEDIPLTDQLCNTIVSFTDTEFFKCASARQVFRKWTIIDWCKTNVSQSSTQLIEITDTRAPELITVIDDQVFPISSINDVQSFIDPWSCFGQFRFPELNLRDDCGSEIDIVWESSTGIIQDSFITNIPKNNVPVAVRATLMDECLNESSILFNVSVLDTITPAAVCKDRLTVSLTTDGAMQNGLSQVNAIDLDGGSGDSGCDSISFSILRFPVRPNVIPPRGSEFISFTCTDLDRDFTVTLVVEDEARNRSSCEVNITVQNTLDLDIQCEDVIVDCLDTRPRRPLIIGDVCNDFLRALKFTEEENNTTVCVQDNILREWFLDIDGDNEISEDEPVCIQRVTLSDADRFDPFSIQWPKHFNGRSVSGVNLECKSDTITTFSDQLVRLGEVQQCVVDSDVMGDLFWCEADCSLIARSVETDTIVTSDFCLQLVNQWTIIDWCTFDSNTASEREDTDSFEAVEDWTGDECPECLEVASSDPVYFRYKDVVIDGYYTFEQLILISDTVAPTITTANVEVLLTGGRQSKSDETACTAEGSVTLSVEDFCGDGLSSNADLIWTLIYDNGTTQSSETLIGNNLMIPTENGTPGSIHQLHLVANDRCGNEATRVIDISFIDKKAPTPLCITGVTTAVIQEEGTTEIWANDFDLGSFDNCSDLSYSIVKHNETPLRPEDVGFEDQASIELSCDELSSELRLDVWFWDNNGNGDFCEVRLSGGGACNPVAENTSTRIYGSIESEIGNPIQQVQLQLNSNTLAEYPLSTFTDDDGYYSFASNPLSHQYELIASKADKASTGVSTLDMLLIQQHLLNTELLDSPYKIIAADVNNDAKISATDILELRNVILGLTEAFSGGYEWKFIDEDYEFLNQKNPWPYVQDINISSLDGGDNNFDFVGIKMGDVSDGNLLIKNSEVEQRTNASLQIEIEDVALVKDQYVDVELNLPNSGFDGFQFTLELDQLVINDLVVENHANADYFGFASFDDLLTMSYFAPVTKNDHPSITLKVKALGNGMLSEKLLVSSSITKNEVYDLDDPNLSTVELKFVSPDEKTILYQNIPNPFANETEIGFYLSSPGTVSFKLFDITGKELMQSNTHYEKGNHSIILVDSELNLPNGILYYELLVDETNFYGVKSMVKID